jgi:hypothetical protein
MNGIPESQMLEFARDAIVPIGIENGTIKVIPLSRGLVAIVDAEDYGWLNQWKWSVQAGRRYPYAARRAKNKCIKMHRLIMGITDPLIWIDHVNRYGVDNRKINLREAAYTLNARNACMRKDNKSGYRGVSWCKRIGKWWA